LIYLRFMALPLFNSLALSFYTGAGLDGLNASSV
jgi:hypothetical protein